VVTWGAVHTLGSLTWAAASVATRSVQTLSGPLRNADSIAPVILPDGTAAVAWSDVATGGKSLLHLAPKGAGNAPSPPVPRVEPGRITQLKHRLSVTVSCSAACDLRASVPGGSEGDGALRKAGTTRVQIDTEDDPIEVPVSGTVPIQLLSGAPGARRPRMRTLKFRLHAISLPHVHGLSAVRRGRAVVIRWRTARAVRHADFIAQATRAGKVLSGNTISGKGRRAFHLQLDSARRADTVVLYVVTERDSAQRRLATTRVR